MGGIDCFDGRGIGGNGWMDGSALATLNRRGLVEMDESMTMYINRTIKQKR